MRGDGGLVVVGTFGQVLEALAARSALESVGIAAFVPDEHTATLLPHTMPGLWGVRLQVRASDELRARRVLRGLTRRPWKRRERDEADEPDEALQRDPLEAPEPRCPSCASRYVYFGYPARLFFFSLLLFGLPLLAVRRRFSCRSCEHEWFDSSEFAPPRALEGPYRKAGGRPRPARLRALVVPLVSPLGGAPARAPKVRAGRRASRASRA